MSYLFTRQKKRTYTLLPILAANLPFIEGFNLAAKMGTFSCSLPFNISTNLYVQLHIQDEAHKLVVSAFRHTEEIVSYDDEASLRTGTCSISEDIYPLNPQIITEDPDRSKITTSHKKGRFDYPPMSALSPDVNVMPAIFPLGDGDSLDEYGLNSMETDELRFEHDESLNLTDTLICDSVSLKGHDDGDIQYFGTSSSSQMDLQLAVDGFLFPVSAIGKAQRRWKIVSSVLKWLSLMLEIRERDIMKYVTPG
ncbi:hypothetical protein R6Q57_000410 [Mikania cordata]